MEGYELKAYERFKEQAQHFRARTYHLEYELRGIGPRLFRANMRIGRLQDRVKKLGSENATLRRRVRELTLKLKSNPKPNPKPALPPFVKTNVAVRRRRKPGRKAGHPAALRPAPAKIDVHQHVPLPIDAAGKVSCTARRSTPPTTPPSVPCARRW